LLALANQQVKGVCCSFDVQQARPLRTSNWLAHFNERPFDKKKEQQSSGGSSFNGRSLPLLSLALLTSLLLCTLAFFSSFFSFSSSFSPNFRSSKLKQQELMSRQSSFGAQFSPVQYYYQIRRPKD